MLEFFSTVHLHITSPPPFLIVFLFSRLCVFTVYIFALNHYHYHYHHREKKKQTRYRIVM